MPIFIGFNNDLIKTFKEFKIAILPFRKKSIKWKITNIPDWLLEFDRIKV